MKIKLVPFALSLAALLIACLLPSEQSNAQSARVRIMAANLTSGAQQSYEAEGIRIFQGLKPDIVAIQEFQVAGGTSSNALRSLIDTAFGPDFNFYCEPNTGIPNGVVSRYPISEAGSWTDVQVADRGFVWAKIALPGTNFLYLVSVHLHSTGGSSSRAIEATNLKALIESSFTNNAWVIVAGDLNTGNRGEDCINTFKTFLSDAPVPSDGRTITNGTYTNAGRSSPYDYVLPSFSLTNLLTSVVVGTETFSNGLVFDSTIYNNNYTLSSVSPVQSGDSHVSGMQHMAVAKDFLIPTNAAPVNDPPQITAGPASQTNSVGANIAFFVTATGTPPLAYQWRFFGTNISTATTNSYSLANLQTTNAGDYTVVITNSFGSITSSIATLAVNTGAAIANQPLSLSVNVGDTATFTVGALGALPFSYQWRFNSTNISSATNTSYTRANAQLADAGNYTVVVTNASGSVTSSNAVLTVNPAPAGNILAQWNFNSPSPDATTGTGTTTPSIGTGSASLVTALTTAFFAGSATDPASAGTDNSGWNTTGYPAITSGNKTAGVRFDVSTVGKQNLSVRWDQRVSNTGSKYSRLQYTTNGTAFLDFPTSVAVVTATTFEAHTNNLSALPGVNNNSLFGFRIVNEFELTATGAGANAYAPAATAYAGSGTTRFDMVTLLGDSISVSNLPALAPTLTNVMLAGNQFHFLLIGTPGSNYLVQAATNLSGTWIPVSTNVAPFTFVESNIFNLPQRFYRGLVAP